MPPSARMREWVARDPASQAQVYDEMMKLFLRHVIGVSDTLASDGIASHAGFGIFGAVRA